jgi:tRNA pseudouridine38-40 synthase
MPRFFITIEYDGGDFVGWQRQDNGDSIQGQLEHAASAILGHRQDIPIQGAGRTDTGVHALGQVAHCDLPDGFTERQLPLALNAHLPPSIRVIKANIMADDAHARFDATMRRYRYRIHTRRIPSPLLSGRVWHFGQNLNVAAMHDAAQLLIGKHDFTSFRATHCQASSPIRTMDQINITEHNDEVHIAVSARSFLHHQVRNITGSLVLIGQGKWTNADLANALEQRQRSAAGQTAPAEGLYLTEVIYPYLTPVSTG